MIEKIRTAAQLVIKAWEHAHINNEPLIDALVDLREALNNSPELRVGSIPAASAILADKIEPLTLFKQVPGTGDVRLEKYEHALIVGALRSGIVTDIEALSEEQIHDAIAGAFAREGLTFSSVRRAAKAVLALMPRAQSPQVSKTPDA